MPETSHSISRRPISANPSQRAESRCGGSHASAAPTFPGAPRRFRAAFHTLRAAPSRPPQVAVGVSDMGDGFEKKKAERGHAAPRAHPSVLENCMSRNLSILSRRLAAAPFLISPLAAALLVACG